MSTTTPKKSGETGHLCLVLDIGQKALHFSPLSVMLALDFLVSILYQVEKVLEF